MVVLGKILAISTSLNIGPWQQTEEEEETIETQRSIVHDVIPSCKIIITVYDRIDAAATINLITQFGAATIRERRLFHSARVQAEKISVKSERKHKDSVLVLLRP